ncbi:3D domain-containing protein, partial [Bacillus cereus group sp. Bce025]
GGAIKGNRIDVLMPDKGSSSQWGRKIVKVTILN